MGREKPVQARHRIGTANRYEIKFPTRMLILTRFARNGQGGDGGRSWGRTAWGRETQVLTLGGTFAQAG